MPERDTERVAIYLDGMPYSVKEFVAMLMEPTFTKSEIDDLIARASRSANPNWQETYRNGFLDGVTAVMVEFDHYRRDLKSE